MTSTAGSNRSGAVVVLGAIPNADSLGQPLRIASEADDVREITRSETVCCIVVVHDPGTADRLEDIRNLSGAYPSLPVVGFVRSDDPTVGSAVVEAGADGYVPAPAFEDPVSELTRQIRNIDRQRTDLRIDPFDAVNGPAIVHDTEDGEIRAANDQFCSRFGYERSELIGTNLGEITAADRGTETPEAGVRVARETGSHTFEGTTRQADGTVVPVEVTLSSVNAPGREYVLGQVRDISGRKTRKRKLDEERALTNAILESLPGAFYAFNEHGQFLRWNAQFSETTGYSDEEIESMHPVEFFPEDVRPRITEAIADVFENDSVVTVEAPFLTADGERIPHEFTGGKMTDGNGETLGLVGVGRNVAERKEQQRRFEAVFNNTYQFTGLMNPDGTLIEANDSALAFAGVDREEVVGDKLWNAHWFGLSEEARQVARESVERAATGEFYRTELTVQGETGTEVIDFSVRPITDDQGEVTLLIPEGRTITDIRRRQKHLGVLHRFLRHNLRNKLTVIEGNAALLAEDLAGTDHEQYASLIRGAAQDLIELGETAHKLSQTVERTDEETRPVDIRSVLTHVAETFNDEYPSASIELTAGTDRYAIADWRIETVFEQLVENAIEHADRGDPTVEIQLTEADDTLSIAIQDDGPGIPEEELVGITTDEEPTPIEHGTGFGLWLVGSVLDDYGATLSYEPVPEGGSRLTIELPKAADRPAATAETREPGKS